MRTMCVSCHKFFKIKGYRCAQYEGAGECDCPKCQGLCLCYEMARQAKLKADRIAREGKK